MNDLNPPADMNVWNARLTPPQACPPHGNVAMEYADGWRCWWCHEPINDASNSFIRIDRQGVIQIERIHART